MKDVQVSCSVYCLDDVSREYPVFRRLEPLSRVCLTDAPTAARLYPYSRPPDVERNVFCSPAPLIALWLSHALRRRPGVIYMFPTHSNLRPTSRKGAFITRWTAVHIFFSWKHKCSPPPSRNNCGELYLFFLASKYLCISRSTVRLRVVVGGITEITSMRKPQENVWPAGGRGLSRDILSPYGFVYLQWWLLFLFFFILFIQSSFCLFLIFARSASSSCRKSCNF